MAINKLTTIPKHAMINPAHPLPPNSVTYPGSGGSFAVHNNVGGVSVAPNGNSWIDDSQRKDHLIQGKMVMCSKTITEMEQLRMGMDALGTQWENEIKAQMVGKLIQEAIAEKCIEFTKQKNVDGSLTIRARMFVTPDTNVRIIREWQK